MQWCARAFVDFDHWSWNYNAFDVVFDSERPLLKIVHITIVQFIEKFSDSAWILNSLIRINQHTFAMPNKVGETNRTCNESANLAISVPEPPTKCRHLIENNWREWVLWADSDDSTILFHTYSLLPMKPHPSWPLSCSTLNISFFRCQIRYDLLLSGVFSQGLTSSCNLAITFSGPASYKRLSKSKKSNNFFCENSE